jgi:hypothetical protein
VATCVPFTPDYACCEDWTENPAAVRERATELAWSALRTLSGGQVGNCPVVVRPCLSTPCRLCADWWWWNQHRWVLAGLHGGDWTNCLCGTPECSCTPLCEIVMPGPVAALVSVELGGVEVALDKFRIDNGHRIVRVDGTCWPSCQDLGAPLGDPGTLGITYVPGIVPDGSALWAAGVLACEFAKACQGGKCRLPAAVTAVARQGVAFTFAGGMFPDGMTGIREVDTYLTAINPNALAMPPMVWSPDVPWAKHRYQTPTVPVVP